VLTLHRPSNVDSPEVLSGLVDFFLNEAASAMPLVWPIHPRTRKELEASGLWDKVSRAKNVILLSPLGYVGMLGLNLRARMVLTDSGGLQEECCVLGTPCLTLRSNTERPITLEENGGVNVLVGNDVNRLRQVFAAKRNQPRRVCQPPLWDGHTAERIVQAMVNTK